MRLGFHNLDVVVRFRIKRVSLRCNAVAEQLAPVLVVIPIQLVILQNRTGNQLAVIRIERLEPVNDALHVSPTDEVVSEVILW